MSDGERPPAVVKIAAILARVLAVALLAPTGYLVVVLWNFLMFRWVGLALGVPVVILAVGLEVAARRGLRGDPGTTRQIGTGVGGVAALAIGYTAVLLDADPIALVVSAAVALLFGLLAWLPSTAAARAWTRTRQPAAEPAHRPPS